MPKRPHPHHNGHADHPQPPFRASVHSRLGFSGPATQPHPTGSVFTRLSRNLKNGDDDRFNQAINRQQQLIDARQLIAPRFRTVEPPAFPLPVVEDEFEDGELPGTMGNGHQLDVQENFQYRNVMQTKKKKISRNGVFFFCHFFFLDLNKLFD